MQKTATIAYLLALVSVIASQHNHDHGALDVFASVLSKLNVTGSEHLPLSATERFVDAVFHRFTCNGNGTALSSCQEAICLNTAGLFTLLGANATVGLDEEQFHGLTSVLLYYALNLTSHCRANVDPSTSNLTEIQDALKMTLDEHNTNVISEDALFHVITRLMSSLSREDHADGHAHLATEAGNAAHSHEVIQEKCLSADGILYLINQEEGAPIGRLEDVALFLVYQLFDDFTIKDSCRLLPKKDYFLRKLFEMFHAVNGSISNEEFIEMLQALNLTATSAAVHTGHAHIHKRSADVTASRQKGISRTRRAALDHDHSVSSWNKTCYDAGQLRAMVRADSSLKAEQFRDICPALIYQQLTGACQTPTSAAQGATTNKPSEAQRWAFSMLSVLIISLCAVFGGIVSCCQKGWPVVYDSVIAVFMGLAVGTLVTDAFLHLLPAALGLHSHGEEASTSEVHASHSSEIGLEASAQRMLTFVMVIIGMYLFEALVTNFCCLSHGHTHSSEKYELGEAANGHPPSESDDKSVTIRPMKPYLTPVVLMVLLGDGIHNFADGLAIGASFSISNSAGLATSIAVFCHELPHELGDLAVLLQAGLRMRTALLLNFLSALTAFAGAAVSLGLLSNLPQAEPWIFVIAAAMFTYIAMACIIPQLHMGKEDPRKGTRFLCTICGMFLGVGVMLILHLFEERIGNLQL